MTTNGSPDARRLIMVRVRTPLRYTDGLDLQRVHGAELENTTEPVAKLLLLQHTPVYTLGRRTQPQDLPISTSDLAARTGADVVQSDRAGSVTYHAPGQTTAYLLLNLQAWGLSLHRHLELLEESAILALKHFGLSGQREAGMTGVWVPTASGVPAKICAIGVSSRRWVTYHGLSLNVDLDLKPFGEIVPCGLVGKSVTSITEVSGQSVDISEVETALCRGFAEAYGAVLEVGMV